MEETLQTLGIYWNKLIAQLICFGVLLFVLQRFAYKPVLQILEERRRRIAKGLADAEKAKSDLAEAEARKIQILTEANQKADQLLAETQKIIAAQTEVKIQQAIAQAEAIMQKAHESITLERDKMLSDVRQEIARLVVEVSGKVTGKILTPEDQQRLNRETLEHLSA